MSDEIGTVESVKAVGDVGCPVGGIVQAVNELLLEKPGIVNTSPEDEGMTSIAYKYSRLHFQSILCVMQMYGILTSRQIFR